SGVLSAELAERGDATQIDKRFGLREPELHEWQEAVSPGDDLRLAVPAELSDSLLDRRRCLISERMCDHRRPSPAARIARQIFSDISCISMCLIPSGQRASITAFAAAAGALMVPASP